jgi:WD40 repeat protein/tetratricopeptide (TPR) repeat protein/TolB-like protein
MLRALDTATGVEAVTYGPDIGQVTAMALSTDGKLLAAAIGNQSGAGYRLQLWADGSTTPLATLFTSPDPLANLCFGADGKYLAASDRAGAVHVWDVARRVEVARLPRQPVVRGLAFDASGQWLVEASRKISVYRIGEWSSEKIISTPSEPLAIAFAGDRQLVASLADGRLERLRVTDGARIFSRTSDSAKAPSIIAVSPDQTVIVAANDQGSSLVWSADGRLLRTIAGPVGTAATALAFQPHTTIVALAGADGIIRTYDAMTGRLLKTLDLGGTHLAGMAFSPDGRTLIAGGQPQAAAAPSRGRPTERSVDLRQRRDYAILFASNDYDVWPALVNPIPDAETLAAVLQDDYGFDVQIVRNATREEILNNLRAAHQRKFGPADQLFIFFAGHGTYDRELAEGFVVATDSSAGDRNHTSQLSYAELRSNIDSIPAPHILVAMDVCQGGMMLASGHRGADDYGLLTLPELLARKANLTTRKLVASGLDDYVSDGVPGHHSPFVSGLLAELRSYGRRQGYLTVAGLFAGLENVKPGPVMGDWGRYEPGSDFFFIPRARQDELIKAAVTNAKPAGSRPLPSVAPASSVRVNSPVRRTIAVLPFRNLKNEQGDAYISAVLGEQLRSELNEAGTMRTLDLSTVEQVAREQHWDKPDDLTPEQLAWAGQNLGADLILSGSFARLGSEVVQVHFQVVSARDGRIVHRYTDSSKESELPSSLLRREGARLRRSVGADDGTPRTAPSLVPQSAEAGALYADGLRRMRRNEFAAARDLFERVVIVEPNFPLAHARLAQAHGSLGYDAKARSESKAAFELREGLGVNEAKLIEGRYYASTAEWQKAIASFSALWEYNGDTVDYALELADVLNASGQRPQAIRLIEQVQERAWAPEEDLRLKIAKAHAFADIADYRRLKAAAEAAVGDAERLAAEQLLAEALWYHSIALRRLGDQDAALKAALRGVQIIGESNPLLQARLLTSIGNVYAEQGQPDAALQVRRRAVDIARAAEDQRDLAGALTNLANVMIGRGELETAAGYYKEAISVAEKIEDQLGEGLGRFNLAGVLRAQGDLSGARGLLEQSERIYRAIHNEPRASRASHEIGMILLETGQVAEAHRRLAAAQTALEQGGGNDYLPGVMLSVGDVLAAEGDSTAAAAQYERVSAICEKVRSRGCTAEYQTSAASVLLDREPQKAATLAASAAETFRSEQAPANELQARIVLAEALLAQRRQPEALEEVTRSEALRVPDRLRQIELAIVAARVRASVDRRAASERLQTLIQDARRIGARRTQFEAELALLEIGGAPSAQSAAAADLLQKEAGALGYGRIAREAARYAQR